jgi:hypothetical protein
MNLKADCQVKRTEGEESSRSMGKGSGERAGK